MRRDPDRPNRRSIRLQKYDYTQAGAYFVTVCTQSVPRDYSVSADLAAASVAPICSRWMSRCS
jgi:hypothetical protein